MRTMLGLSMLLILALAGGGDVAVSAATNTVTFSVPPTAAWTESGLMIQPGDVVTIAAKGTWSPWSPADGYSSCGPEGKMSMRDVVYGPPSPYDYNWGCLMGLIGSTLFPVGFGGSFTATDELSGSLSFRPNEDDHFGGEGALTVTVTVKTQAAALTVQETPGGSASADPTSGIKGSTSTLTANPDLGFFFSRWVLIQSGGGTLSSPTTNPATFTFGNSNAVVAAQFDRDPTPPEDIRGGQPDIKGEASKNLIVVVHGANDSAGGWVAKMVSDLRSKIDPKSTSVFPLDWSVWAKQTMPILKIPTADTLSYSEETGRRLAKYISSKNYEHVHLIGHSLGGRVIQTATTVLRRNGCSVTVHDTFLDAYTTLFRNWDDEFGTDANYSEHYFNSTDYPATDCILPNAANVDITGLRGNGNTYPDAATDGTFFPTWLHGWPYRWYTATIIEAPGHNESNVGKSGCIYGFLLSKESKPSGWETGFLPTAGSLEVLGDAASSQRILTSRSRFSTVGSISLKNPIAKSSSLNSRFESPHRMKRQSGAAIWASYSFDLLAPADTLRLKVLTSSPIQSDGLLSIYVDGQRVAFFLEKSFLSSTNELSIDLPTILTPTNHVFSFRVDPGSTPSDMRPADMVLGRAVQVPVVQLVPNAGQSMTMSWAGAAGYEYQPQYTSTLTGTTWTNLGPRLKSASNNVPMSVYAPIDRSHQKFYRVLVYCAP